MLDGFWGRVHRSGMAQFILRKREYLGQVPRAFGGNVPTYSAWQTVSAWATLEQAEAARDGSSKSGMWTHAIFHRGKKLR